MRIGFKSFHWLSPEGNPAGGCTTGTGFTISWQNGPLGRIDTPERVGPNGAFVEDVLEAVLDRIKFYQTGSGGRFACVENAEAIDHIERALLELDKRTKRRVNAGTEGTHEGR